LIGAPPPIICRRAADAILLCTYFVAIFDRRLEKGHQKILRIERNFFENRRKKFFGRPRGRRRPKFTGAPPPTQWRRRRALVLSRAVLTNFKTWVF